MSHNVFADLGFDNADELLETADLGLELVQRIRGKFFDLDYLAQLLDATNAEVVALVNHDYCFFAADRLREFLAKVEQWKP